MAIGTVDWQVMLLQQNGHSKSQVEVGFPPSQDSPDEPCSAGRPPLAMLITQHPCLGQPSRKRKWLASRVWPREVTQGALILEEQSFRQAPGSGVPCS